MQCLQKLFTPFCNSVVQEKQIQSLYCSLLLGQIVIHTHNKQTPYHAFNYSLDRLRIKLRLRNMLLPFTAFRRQGIWSAVKSFYQQGAASAQKCGMPIATTNGDIKQVGSLFLSERTISRTYTRHLTNRSISLFRPRTKVKLRSIGTQFTTCRQQGAPTKGASGSLPPSIFNFLPCVVQIHAQISKSLEVGYYCCWCLLVLLAVLLYKTT